MGKRLRIAILLIVWAALIPSPSWGAPVVLPAPLLLEPQDGSSFSSPPVFSWGTVGGAEHYIFQLTADPLFAGAGGTYEAITKNLKHVPIGWLADRSSNAPYYWRIGVPEGAGKITWSAVRSFNIKWDGANKPNVTGPPDNSAFIVPRDSIVLTWDPVPNTVSIDASYEIQLSTADNFATSIQYFTKNTSFAVPPTELANDTTYYWRMSSVVKNGLGAVTMRSAWSDIRTFQKSWQSQPVTTAPADTFSPSLDEPTFRWTAVDGARDYQVQISPNGDWANNVVYGGPEGDPFGQVWGKAPVLGLLSSLEDNQYYWRVRARDAGNFAGTWSQSSRFQRAWLDAPALTYPAQGEAVTIPEFRWNPIPNASRYRIQISEDSNFNGCLNGGTFIDAETDNTTFSPWATLTGSGEGCAIRENQALYWRVRGIDYRTAAGPIVGPWSQGGVGRLAFLNNPIAPIPLSPPSGSTLTETILSWTPVTFTNIYIIDVFNIDGSPFRSYETVTTSIVLPDLNPLPGQPARNFKWRVSAKSGGGQQSPYIGEPTFTMTTTNLVNAVPVITSPSNDWSGTSPPRISWTGAMTMEIWYSTNGTVFQNYIQFDQFIPNVKGSNYIPRRHLPSGTYYFYLKNELGQASPTQQFHIVDMLFPTLLDPANNVVATTTPTMRWNPMLGASGYAIVIAKDALFNTIYRDGRVDATYRTVYPTFTPRDSFPDTQAGQGYYWMAVPSKSSNPPIFNGFFAQHYPLAFTYSKQTPAPVQVAPIVNATVSATPHFQFQRVSGARHYRLMVSTDPNFGTGIVDDVVTDSSSYSPLAKTYPDGTMYWRVQAIDASNNSLTWSPSRRFTKVSPAPAIVRPDPGVQVGGTPYLVWNYVPGAVRYDVQVSTQSNFGALDDQATVTGGTAYVPSNKTYAPGTYFWRVRGRDASDNPMSWSDGGVGRTFIVDLGRPTPINPIQQAYPKAGWTMSWSNVPLAASYRVEIKDASGAAFESRDNIMTTEWAPLKEYPEGTYRWRVFPRLLGGAEGPSGPEATFFIGKPTVGPLPNSFRLYLPNIEMTRDEEWQTDTIVEE